MTFSLHDNLCTRRISAYNYTLSSRLNTIYLPQRSNTVATGCVYVSFSIPLSYRRAESVKKVMMGEYVSTQTLVKSFVSLRSLKLRSAED